MFYKFKKVLVGIALLGGIMNGNCAESDTSIFVPYPFVSTQILYRSAEDASSGKISNANILECVNKTVEYYQNLTATPDGFTVDLETWKNSKIVEALRNISQCFQDLEISPYCINKILEICCGGMPQSEVTDKNFRYARFLIISQCKKWCETSGQDIELVRSSDGSTIGTAIGMLKSATNGDTSAAKRLLILLKNSGKFEGFLG